MQGLFIGNFSDAVISCLRRSSVVQKVLLGAFAEGRQFSVVVVDSRPMMEGRDSQSHLIGFLPILHLRQKATVDPLVYRDSVHLSPPACSGLYHKRSVNGPRGGSLNSLKRCGLFKSRYRFGSYDGQATLRPCCRVLRDLQILRLCAIR